jgi:hypothetical protein
MLSHRIKALVFIIVLGGISAESWALDPAGEPLVRAVAMRDPVQIRLALSHLDPGVLHQMLLGEDATLKEAALLSLPHVEQFWHAFQPLLDGLRQGKIPEKNAADMMLRLAESLRLRELQDFEENATTFAAVTAQVKNLALDPRRDIELRITMIHILGQFYDHLGLPAAPLLSLLQDDSPAIRLAATEIFSARANADTLAALQKRVLEEADLSVSTATAATICRLLTFRQLKKKQAKSIYEKLPTLALEPQTEIHDALDISRCLKADRSKAARVALKSLAKRFPTMKRAFRKKWGW